MRSRALTAVRSLRAQIGTPGVVAGTRLVGEHLTVGVGSGQTSQIAPVSGPIARDEERHRRLGILCGDQR